MRHIPEDELHAYLDQALSRSQCVEIETHLAECGACRDGRDAIAAVRDRTTALLGALTPRRLIVPPPLALLAERKGRSAFRARWQERVKRAGLWAAGVAAAVGAGWVARTALDPHRNQSAPVTASLALTPATVEPRLDLPPVQSIPIPPQPTRTLVARSAARHGDEVVPAPSLQLASLVLPAHSLIPTETSTSAAAEDSHSPFERIWRVVSWEEALQLAGSGLPYIEGMPVVGVLVQPGAPGERPTVIVAQQYVGGDIIQSIEGPVGKVNELLQRQSGTDIHASEPARTPPDYVDGPAGVHRTLRILAVTGRLAVDSLNALARSATIR
ncbi:MAG TPA: zf-HC2 domain-containing protein [Gemmatimonadales bacterium]|jgi:hypothetical protein|nr:zf-HC2 domain-containing protein [Gemmatimonadales bacterium]